MKSGTGYSQGDLVLVPFPFTDLSSVKRRPGVVVSPTPFHRHQEDVVLVAVTFQIPQAVSEFELPLTQKDMAIGTLPRQSVIRLTKLFTVHQRLIVKRVGRLRGEALERSLKRLRAFFSRR